MTEQIEIDLVGHWEHVRIFRAGQLVGGWQGEDPDALLNAIKEMCNVQRVLGADGQPLDDGALDEFVYGYTDNLTLLGVSA